MSDVVVAVDVGGTVIKSAVVTKDAQVLARLRVPTSAALGTDVVYNNIVESVETLRTQLDEDSRVVAVGVVVTGIVDEKSGSAIHSENVGWNNIALRPMLEEQLGLPVGFGHDVRAGALAEGRLGAARGYDDYVFVAIGTGVSAGVIVAGQMVTGGGYAGEIGHINSGRDVLCACGGNGCVEAVASASAVARRYSELTGEDVDGAKEVAERVQAGDPAALAVWADAVDGLATAIAWTGGVISPQAVVVGGGMASAGELLLAPLREQLAIKLNILRAPELVQAQLGDEAGCLGSALLAWEAFDTSATNRQAS